MTPTPKNVYCDVHGIMPYSLVCNHLLRGERAAWHAIPVQDVGSEVIYDWVCPDCRLVGADNLTADDAGLMCIGCIREAQRQHGEVFDPAGRSLPAPGADAIE